jgi:hypothetical protein
VLLVKYPCGRSLFIFQPNSCAPRARNKILK